MIMRIKLALKEFLTEILIIDVKKFKYLEKEKEPVLISSTGLKNKCTLN